MERVQCDKPIMCHLSHWKALSGQDTIASRTTSKADVHEPLRATSPLSINEPLLGALRVRGGLFAM